MKLWKAHGLGNDYLIWEEPAIPVHKEYVQRICHRSKGVGSDGILEPMISDVADYGVRIWNPDGSLVEKSGNGLRIFAHWLHYTQGAPTNFSIDTGSCIVRAEIRENVIALEMGHALWSKEQIPTTETIWGSKHVFEEAEIVLYAVGLGNPHCVSFFDSDQSLDDLPWRRWGAALEMDKRFPNRSNIQFARVLSRSAIEIRIWERGAGETSASGSSSCAVASVAYRLGWVDQEITMYMPGGILQIFIDNSGELLLIGPVQEIGRTVLHPDFLR